MGTYAPCWLFRKAITILERRRIAAFPSSKELGNNGSHQMYRQDASVVLQVCLENVLPRSQLSSRLIGMNDYLCTVPL